MKYKNINLSIIGLILVFCSAFSNADYEKVASQIDYIYLFEHGTDQWGVRIVLEEPGTDCSEWYIKINSDLSNQMYSLALSAEAQNKKITLMRRNSTENLDGTTVCGIHRIYSKEIL